MKSFIFPTPFCNVKITLDTQDEDMWKEVKWWFHQQTGTPTEEDVKKVLEQFDEALAKAKEQGSSLIQPIKTKE